ncbi:MAG: cytochrome b/b6 domain-containing protein [Burkholderiaceae bacterium]|nr:cytochrome b/b6 domain-containing protein [Burkholderiaceae bacterium]
MSSALSSRNDCGAAPDQRVRVWDLPTRLFHWLLALDVCALIGSGWLGDMEWHFRFGYMALALLVFRILWGFVGGHWSRFASFIYSPRSLQAYLCGKAPPDHHIGHSPLGALSVFAVLAILVVQVATGLMSDDQISAAGPLTRFVSGDTVDLATSWHAGPGQWIVIALVVLHVLAVLFYVLVQRKGLLRPMVTGDRMVHHRARSSRDTAASRTLALVIIALTAALAWWMASLQM